MMWQYGASMMIWMLVFWVGVIALIVWALRNVGDNKVRLDRPNRPIDLLEERYARGEIDSAEFHARRSELERT